jgi:phenylacetate-CoA ligase
MSLYTKIISSCIFPLHELLKKHSTVKARKSMEQSQWLSCQEIQQLQINKLKNLLIDIQEHVPYYRQLFNQLNFNPESITSLKDLTQLPLTSKSIIRQNLEQLKANDALGLARFNTGGSSGEPLIFYIGNRRVSHDVAAKWRATRWWGVDIGDPEIVIWGSPIELGSQDKVRVIRDKLLRTHLIPAFEMSVEKVSGFIQQIQTFRPRILFGYPSALAHIAKQAEKDGISLDNQGIKVAFVTSERLYDYQREIIEKVFACPVANGYGGRDAGFIAHQCPDGSMHITAEDIIIEIVDKNGQNLPYGEAGEIVVTHLATRDFPFIRYQTGDVGVLSDEQCRCGRGLPVLKEIQGRTSDFIVAQDGTVLHGLAMIYILRDIDGVEEFKIIQQSKDRTDIHIVTNIHYKHSEEVKIVSAFKARLGQSVDIKIEYIDKIEKEKSGKFRYVISHVKPD